MCARRFDREERGRRFRTGHAAGETSQRPMAPNPAPALIAARASWMARRASRSPACLERGWRSVFLCACVAAIGASRQSPDPQRHRPVSTAAFRCREDRSRHPPMARSAVRPAVLEAGPRPTANEPCALGVEALRRGLSGLRRNMPAQRSSGPPGEQVSWRRTSLARSPTQVQPASRGGILLAHQRVTRHGWPSRFSN